MDNQSSSDEEDTHQCGRCQAVFNSIDLYFQHKKLMKCRKIKFNSEEAARPNILTEAVTHDALDKPYSSTSGRDNTDDIRHGGASGAKGRPEPYPSNPDTGSQSTPPKKKWAKDHSSAASDDHNLKIENVRSLSCRTRAKSSARCKSRRVRKTAMAAKGYHCSICPSVHYTEMELDRHMRSVHSVRRHVCEDCGLAFTDQAKLRRHTALKSKRCHQRKLLKEEGVLSAPSHVPHKMSPKAWKEEDGQKTIDEDADTGTKMVHVFEDRINKNKLKAKSEFCCDECNASYDTYREVLDHLEDHHPGIRPAICPFCGKWFDAKYRLLRHLSSLMHDDVPETDVSHAKAQIMKQKFKWAKKIKRPQRLTQSKPSYPCSKCKEEFSTSSDLARHKASSHGKPVGPELTCDSCLEPFHKRATYQIHLQEAHGIADPGPTLTCPACLQTYRQRCHVYRHLDTMHTPKSNVPLTILQELESQESDWSWLQRHRQNQLYTCFICRKQISSESLMRQHIQTHRMFAVRTEDGFSVDQAHCLFAMLYQPLLKESKPPQEHQSCDDTLYIEITTDISNTESAPTVNLNDHIANSQEGPYKMTRETLFTVDTSSLGEMEQDQCNVLQIMEEMGNRIGKEHGTLDDNIPRRSSGTATSTSNKDQTTMDSVSTRGEEIHRCCYCLAICSDVYTLYHHKIETHTMALVFHCVAQDCRVNFESAQKYDEHSQEHPQTAFICFHCNGHFSSSDAVAKHKFDCHRSTSLDVRTTCRVCHKDFADKEKLRDHMATAHSDRTCSQCGKTMRTQALLTDHLLEHAGIDSYLCSTCGLSFGNRVALSRHRLTHREEETHECDQCTETFKTKVHLVRHRLTRHSVVKPFACNVEGCDSRFSRKDKLKDHMRIHSQEKPYQCSVCKKAYRYREGLRYHFKTHARVSKFFCQQCNQGFSKPSLLREHLSEVHQTTMSYNKAYPCADCKLCFSRPERLQRHRERDHGRGVDWKYTCEICLKGFAGWRSYETHLKRSKHSGESLKSKEQTTATKPTTLVETNYSFVSVANTACTVDALSNALGTSLQDAPVMTVEASPGSIIQLPNQPNIQISTTSLPQLTFGSDPSQKQDLSHTVTVLQLTPAAGDGENKSTGISYVPSSVALPNQASVTFFPGLQFTNASDNIPN